MSATASPGARWVREGHPWYEEPLRLRAWFWATGIGVVSFLAVGLGQSWNALLASVGIVGLWIIVTAAADLMPVTLWGTVSLSMSLPVTLAAGMVLPPVWAGLIAFTGACDIREFRGEVRFARALYNRSQVAASVMLASFVFHALGGDLRAWPVVLPISVLALAVDWVANTVMVVIPVGILSRVSVTEVLRRVHGNAPLEHAFGYMCLGLLSVLLGVVAIQAGVWGLFAFLLPIAIAREMFSRGRRLEAAQGAILEKDKALASSTQRVLEERKDERMAVAGELHDEVLPPLFKVHLMGQVLRQDLSSGRLLSLDEDLPELLSATEAAQGAVRLLVNDLRRSSLGPAGLNATLQHLARQLESSGATPIELQLDEVGGAHSSQLLTYQVAREALNNAVRHSRAQTIRVRLWRENETIRLTVADDGTGFDSTLVDSDLHFGLQLIAERVFAGGGTVDVDSRLGGGTTVSASVPAEPP
jgi:two-component system NarL family sensor kinase